MNSGIGWHKVHELEFESRGLKLSATLALPDGEVKGALFRISGGYLTGHRPNDWQARLAQDGIASFAFDFVGVGDSEGKLEETNLLIRLEDAQAGIQAFKKLLDPMTKVFVLGVSMGGPIAIWLAERQPMDGLILTVPAAYSKSAYDKNFGAPFSQAIRGEGTWHDTLEFAKLKSLTIPMLLVNALRDEIIPKAVTPAYSEIVIAKQSQVIDYDVAHPFLRVVDNDNDVRTDYWAAVSEFILRA